jgi:hypothetical protein
MGYGQPVPMDLEIGGFTVGGEHSSTRCTEGPIPYILRREEQDFQGRRDDSALCYGRIDSCHRDIRPRAISSGLCTRRSR